MMYQPPHLQHLLHISHVLKEYYLGKNTERLSFIQLYNRLTRLTQLQENSLRESILCSAGIFEIVTIENQYNFLSPSRSALYQLLIRHFNITPINPLSLDDRLIYLVKFFHFVQNNIDSDLLADLSWQNKTGLLDQIRANIIAILNKQAHDIKHLLADHPVASALEKNIAQLLSDYKQILAARWFPNSERRALLSFLETINESCQHYTKQLQINYIPLQNDLIRNVRLGLVLFSLMKIDKGYAILSSKPTEIYGNTLFGSQFFKNGLKTINIKTLHQLNTDTKISWLRTLSMYIKSLKEQDKTFEQWQNFEKEIDDFLMQEEIKINQPSRPREYLNSLISCAAHYGITFAITQFAAQATMPSLETAIIGTISGPVGVVIYSAAGTIIASQLIELLKEKLIPAALAGLYAKILTRIGDLIGQTTTGMITLTFNATTQGLTNLLNFYSIIQTEDEYKKK